MRPVANELLAGRGEGGRKPSKKLPDRRCDASRIKASGLRGYSPTECRPPSRSCPTSRHETEIHALQEIVKTSDGTKLPHGMSTPHFGMHSRRLAGDTRAQLLGLIASNLGATLQLVEIAESSKVIRHLRGGVNRGFRGTTASFLYPIAPASPCPSCLSDWVRLLRMPLLAHAANTARPGMYPGS